MALQTPGVYINEQNAFPNSVIPVETSIPAFIGYTEKTKFNEKSLKNKPVRIESFAEFKTFFGQGCPTTYNLNSVSSLQEQDFELNGVPYKLDADADTRFLLYDSLKFFYQNGGASCFIISIGMYTDIENDKPFTSITPFTNAIDLLKKEIEPTMVVVPDAVLFNRDDCYRLQEYMLMHCGNEMNRIAILDIHDGYKGLSNPYFNPIDNFRNNVSSDFFSYGAAYYPWLHTTIVQPSEVNYKNLNDDGIQTLKAICEVTLSKQSIENQKTLTKYLESLSNSDEGATEENDSNTILSTAIPDYKIVMEHLLKKQNLLPPSGAMAGIYTLVDSNRGCWKAPANVAVSSVTSPSVLIDHEQQEDLNAPLQGKAICAIRPFTGLGTMVWGARTLDANSLDWRYINVKRTMIMIEQSIKNAVKAYVFEPNVKNTWVSIEAMTNNFLTNLWKKGALAGAVPTDAFSVSVGLGATMTANDILEGRMNITVRVAISHPAEFIVITFQQQQQKS
jgi:phage tail sheath protein FI